MFSVHADWYCRAKSRVQERRLLAGLILCKSICSGKTRSDDVVGLPHPTEDAASGRRWALRSFCQPGFESEARMFPPPLRGSARLRRDDDDDELTFVSERLIR
jgi:hypothetical protein